MTSMENTENLSAVGRDILDSARTQLCMALPYLTSALCALAFAPGDGVTVSAATDGSAYYYYAPCLAALYLRSSGAVCRLYLHSVLHCLFRHLHKRRGRDAALWDLACDAAAESVLDSLALPCLAPVQTPIRKKFWGECRAQMKVLTAEGIYRMLLSERRPEYEIAQLSRAFSLDDHGLWDAEEKRDREQSERQDKNWQKLANEAQSAMGSFFTADGAGGEAVTEQLSVAARDDVDYRRFLRRFAAPREVLKSDVDAFDYSYYSYGLRLYGNMPLIEPPETKEEDRIEELVIAVDTSMSTSGELVRRFLENTYAVLRSTDTFTRRLNIHILQCDDQLRDDALIRDASELRRYMAALPLTGGSATDFRPVFEHIETLQRAGQLKNLRGLLYFTDGMGIYPTRRPPYEVAFILLSEPPMALEMPRWAIRLVPELSDAGPVKQLDESVWIEDILAELPEL